MQHSSSKIFLSVIVAFAIAATVGCGKSGKWFDSGGAELLYAAQIRMDADTAGKNPFKADTSCAAMLPMAQKSLSDSSNAGMDVQVMYKTCNDAGLKFQNEVRCEADRLQVLCG
jgi:hypothetical protein